MILTRQLTAQGMKTYHGRPLSRATLSIILRNPIYVMADLDIYEFFKSQGTDIINDAADFTGTNGCYYYQGKDNAENKHKHLQKQLEKAIAGYKETIAFTQQEQNDVSAWLDILSEYADIKTLDRSIVVNLIDSITISEQYEVNGIHGTSR